MTSMYAVPVPVVEEELVDDVELVDAELEMGEVDVGLGELELDFFEEPELGALAAHPATAAKTIRATTSQTRIGPATAEWE